MTMRSMTGFAQKRFTFNRYAINISIKSLNHRFLDISVKGSGVTPVTEKLVKDIMKKSLLRGKVEVVFDLFMMDSGKWDIQFNEFLLEDILDKVLHFSKKYKDNVSLSLDPFLKIPMIFHLDSLDDELSEEDFDDIKKSVEAVFEEFLETRNEEGKSVQKDLTKSLKKIEESLSVIKESSANLEKELFDNYLEKMKKYLEETDIDERRLVQEAAIAAEKSCISEEINRLHTHCQRMGKLVKSRSADSKGREGDFLTQEMLRETHTISAKTYSAEIQDQVILVRREIEKIKQQIQNVE